MPWRRTLRGLMGTVVLAAGLACPRGTALAQGGARDPVPPDTAAVTLARLAEAIRASYFDPALAARIAAAVDSHARRTAGERSTTTDAFVERVNQVLAEAGRDKHLRLEPSAPAAARADNAPSRPAPAPATPRHGVRGVRIESGNVGVLRLDAFARPEDAREAVQGAMRSLAGARGVIVDLRANGGGSPDMVAYFLGAFLPPGTPLFSITGRDTTNRRWYATPTEGTLTPIAPGTRVLVLTSRETFSAGEGAAFLLQEHRRAVIVGERTAGAANPGRPYDIGAWFRVTIPNGQVRSALTGRNWEGTGVVPDHEVRAADAMTRALAMLQPRGDR